MLVRELIEELKKYDENIPVCVSDLEMNDHLDGWVETHNVVFSIIKKEEHYNNKNGNEVFGNFISLIC